jgi:hypothetical protein
MQLQPSCGTITSLDWSKVFCFVWRKRKALTFSIIQKIIHGIACDNGKPMAKD